MELQNEEARLVVVLGTSHALQMGENREDSEHNVDDPVYSKLLEKFRTGFGMSVDCVFEEASECGPTAAEKLAGRWSTKYIDMDPHPNNRHLYGIEATGEPMDEYFDPGKRMFAEEHFKREDLWTKRIREEPFRAALVICGLAHTLSLAGRLISVGFEVHTYGYMPHDKLCRRPHTSIATFSKPS